MDLNPTWVWYVALCVLGAVNIAACCWICSSPLASPGSLPASLKDNLYVKRMRWLGAPFVLVCAYRGFFPNIYLTRVTLIDTALSSILVSRTLACFAELSWVIQIASAVKRVNEDLTAFLGDDGCGPRVVWAVAAWTVLNITAAECFSFMGTITQNSLWFMLEEGSWVVVMTLLTPTAFYLTLRCRQAAKQDFPLGASLRFSAMLLLCGIVYVPWGWTQDVPNNYNRWREEVHNHNHTQFLSFSDGLEDALNRRDVTTDWEGWSSYVVWMTAYFSFGVWSSILMMYSAPRFLNTADHVQERLLA